MILAQATTLAIPTWMGPVLGGVVCTVLYALLNRSVSGIDEAQRRCDELSAAHTKELAELKTQVALLAQEVQHQKTLIAVATRLDSLETHLQAALHRAAGQGTP